MYPPRQGFLQSLKIWDHEKRGSVARTTCITFCFFNSPPIHTHRFTYARMACVNPLVVLPLIPSHIQGSVYIARVNPLQTHAVSL